MPEGIIAVQEERVRVGGVVQTKRTLLKATDAGQGFVFLAETKQFILSCDAF